MISFEKIRPGPKMRTKHKLSKEVKSTWEIYHDTVIYAYQRTYRNTHTHITTEPHALTEKWWKAKKTITETQNSELTTFIFNCKSSDRWSWKNSMNWIF